MASTNIKTKGAKTSPLASGTRESFRNRLSPPFLGGSFNFDLPYNFLGRLNEAAEAEAEAEAEKITEKQICQQQGQQLMAEINLIDHFQ